MQTVVANGPNGPQLWHYFEYQLPVTYFAKFGRIVDRYSGVQKAILCERHVTVDLAADFELHALRQLLEELRRERLGGLRRATSAPALL